ncbi:MAG: ROK family protein [Anaeromyxobacter sp.]
MSARTCSPAWTPGSGPWPAATWQRSTPATWTWPTARGIYARGLWDENGELLGTAIANYITTLNPARLILGGGVILGCPRFEGIVRRHIDEEVLRAARRDLSVERAYLGDDAGVVGAAVLE